MYHSTKPYLEELSVAQALLMPCKSVAIFSGAGISAESGIATFRDPQTGALWDKFDPDKLASMNGFAENPQLVWDWYISRREMCKEAHPNLGHLAIGKLESLRTTRVITQNVDDLHERGGSTDVVHIHGDLDHASCVSCDWRGEFTELTITQSTPSCPLCGNLARPSVVWFGEMLPTVEWSAAENICMTHDLLIIVGTSGNVSPASGLPWLAKKSGRSIISINTRISDHCAYADVRLTGTSGKILTELIESLS